MKRRSKKYNWLRKLSAQDREALMKECYAQALRVGSVRAVELRRLLGPNKLYRWIHMNGLKVIRERKNKCTL